MDVLFHLTGVVIGFEQPSYQTTETDATTYSVLEVYVIVQRGILRRDVVVTAFTQEGIALGVNVCVCVYVEVCICAYVHVWCVGVCAYVCV